MDKGMIPELLAPAGDMEGVAAALRYGADAVYLGGSFMQMRAASAGFSDGELAVAAELIHGAGKKLHVTVNCFAENSEIPKIGDYARMLQDAGADAAIVSDIGAMAEMKRAAPELPIHVSTQANCTNYRSAEVYYNMGASLVVLARELSLEQIAELRAKTPKELRLEAFVHGAMCMAYSGRCLLSAFLTGRSGNRGECAQSCRWSYRLEEAKRPGEYFPVEDDGRGSAILSSFDLCAVTLLDRLREAGVSAFKIEGRMKSPYYVAAVTNAYRMALDGSAPMEAIQRELCSVSHRPYCTGFYLGPVEQTRDFDGEYIRECTFVGTAAGSCRGGRLELVTRNFFREGDVLEIVSPGAPGRAFTAARLTDENGMPADRSSRPLRRVTLDCPWEASEGDVIRLRKNTEGIH